MTELSMTLMIASRILVLALGLVITVLGVRAYRRKRAAHLRNAAIGFGIVTLGVFVEGGLYHAAGYDLVTVHIVESLVVSVGFIVILDSLR